MCGVSRDPSCSSNGDLDDAKEGIYDDANFSHRDLVLYFRHQLRVKIRCDRKRLDRITFDKCLVNTASLVERKGAMLESSFPPVDRTLTGAVTTGQSGPWSDGNERVVVRILRIPSISSITNTSPLDC